MPGGSSTPPTNTGAIPESPQKVRGSGAESQGRDEYRQKRFHVFDLLHRKRFREPNSYPCGLRLNVLNILFTKHIARVRML